MLRAMLRLAGAVAAAVVLVDAVGPAAPPGWEYDEIVRPVSAGDPFPPDISADRAAIAAASPVPSPTATPRRRGRAPAAEATPQHDAGALAAVLSGLPAQGRLLHHALFGGWERIDDPAAGMVTIRKCDLGQVIRLDLARRTYHVDDVLSEPPPLPPALTKPGSADVEIAVSATPLPARTVDGIAATGVAEHDTVAVRGATGSCGSGDRQLAVDVLSYVARQDEPLAAGCLLGAGVPASAVNVVAPPHGGCRPVITAQRSGVAVPSGRFVVARRLVVDGTAGIQTERGDVRPLAAADAARFDVPPGFTRSP